MGISRDSKHKRRSTGGKRKVHRKKRKFELGRPPAATRVGEHRIHPVRCRGGRIKFRALRLETGNYSWPSEAVTRKTRILGVVYNASNNELVRTNTLVKNCIVQIDATPFRQWYEQHYGIVLGKAKKATGPAVSAKAEEHKDKKPAAGGAAAATSAAPGDAATPAAKGESMRRKLNKRRKDRIILAPALEEQYTAGRLYACVTSRPGQCGRCDGYILEGEELNFYLRKLQKKKGGKGQQ